MKKIILTIFGLLIMTTSLPAQDIKLPPAEKHGGAPLMDCLSMRQTTREFESHELDPMLLSNLMWATFGINRPEEGKRTAPSAHNMQEIDVYVAMKSGLYLYDAKSHTLIQKSTADIRKVTGKQDFVATAPVNLIFVANKDKMEKVGEDEKRIIKYAAVDTGFLSQNVYLFCAGWGLGTVARGWFDVDELSKAMNLGENQFPVLAQTVGFPKKS
jgi:SagB-type dehydrogenase family enzyme